MSNAIDYEPLIEAAGAELKKLKRLDAKQRDHARPRAGKGAKHLHRCRSCRWGRFPADSYTGTCFYPDRLRRPYRRGFSSVQIKNTCDAWEPPA